MMTNMARRRRPFLHLAILAGTFIFFGIAILLLLYFTGKNHSGQYVPPQPSPDVQQNNSEVGTFDIPWPLLFKNKLVTLLAEAEPKSIILVLVGILAVITVIIIISRIRATPQLVDHMEDVPDSNYVYSSNQVDIPAAILVLVIIILVIIYFVPLPNSPIKMVAKEGKYKEKSIACRGFTDSYNLKLIGMVKHGETMSDFLTSVFNRSHSTSISALLDDNICQQDFIYLVYKYLESKSNVCSHEESHLTTLDKISIEAYPSENPNVAIANPSTDGSLEIAFTDRPFDPIVTFAPHGLHLSRIIISDYNLFIDNRGKLIVAVKGEKRVAVIIAIVASHYNSHGCSVSKSGKCITESIQSALELFLIKQPECLQYSIIQQIREGSTFYIDIVQAGILAVSVRSKESSQVSAQTGFAPESAKDVKFYRLPANSGDYVTMYTNMVAYNALPSIIASSPRAALLAAKVSAMFSRNIPAMHIPYQADHQPCSPMIPPDGENILTISRAVRH